MSGQVNPGGILQLGLGFWGSKTLLSAVELGVFTELAKGPADEAALCARFQLHARSARLSGCAGGAGDAGAIE